MSKAIDGWNRFATGLGDVLLRPFLSLPPWVALVFWAVLAGLAMALVFRWTSNQRALRAAADRCRSELLAIRIFRDDLGVGLRGQFALLAAVGRRLWHALPPVLVLSVPVALVLVQLALRYEHRPLAPGESAVVEVAFAPAAWAGHRDLQLVASEGVMIETPALRDDARHVLCWRVRPLTASPASLRWRMSHGFETKLLAVADEPSRPRRVSVRRAGRGWLERLLHPGEAGVAPGALVEAIIVRHPRRSTPVLGVDVPWWLTFFVVAMAAAWAAGRVGKIAF